MPQSLLPLLIPVSTVVTSLLHAFPSLLYINIIVAVVV